MINSRIYDYAILGAGAAGLTLAVKMLKAGLLQDKTLVIIEKDDKKSNDRTWCFWEKNEGPFESIVSKKWDNFLFYNDNEPLELTLSPYQYKLIHGKDFYDHCIDLLKQQTNIHWIQDEVISYTTDTNTTIYLQNNQVFNSKVVFDSFFSPAVFENQKGHHLLQHFKGWLIEFDEPILNDTLATFMDFRVSQNVGCNFFYVLPLNQHKALVEYTLFTKDLLTDDQYEEAIINYLQTHYPTYTFRVLEKEFGIIPMTSFKFKPNNGMVIKIGTAGGWTKSSTGFTFQFIQLYTDQLIESLQKKNLKNWHPRFSKKHHLYDSVLLRLMSSEATIAKKTFSQLFNQLPTSLILKFLDNQSNFLEDIRIMNSVDRIKFMKASFKEIFINK